MDDLECWGLVLIVLSQLLNFARTWINTKAAASIAVERTRAAGLRELALCLPPGSRLRDLRSDGSVTSITSIAVESRTGDVGVV